jgi:hypothetical protein
MLFTGLSALLHKYINIRLDLVDSICMSAGLSVCLHCKGNLHYVFLFWE